MRTAEQIFSDISAHQIKGLMVHSQLADYYRFLGLEKYADCHEDKYCHESKSWRKLSIYYVTHYNKLIPEKEIENPNVIPSDWYAYLRQDVEATTKRRAVASGLKKWIEWEQETKAMYEQAFSDLLALGEGAGAMRIKKCLCDVDNELAEAQKYMLNKKAVDYDIVHLVEDNDEH